MKIRNFSDLMKSSLNDSEAIGYIVVTLATYAMQNKGISAQQLEEICNGIGDYYEAKQERRA